VHSRVLPIVSGVLALVLGLTAAPASADPPPVRVIETPVDPSGTIDDATGDCGWSEELHDGKVLWITCDSAGLSNRVGIAASGTPTDPQWQALSLVAANPSSPPPPCPSGSSRAYWTTGLEAIPQVTTTKVIVAFSTFCRNSSANTTLPTIGFASATYDGSYHPTTDPIRAVASVYDTFAFQWSDGTPTTELGTDGLLWDGTYVNAYACAPTASGASNTGRCIVARASLTANLSVRGSWRFWTAGTWVSPGCGSTCTLDAIRPIAEAATSVEIPNASFSPSGAEDPALAPGRFDAEWVPDLGLYVATVDANWWLPLRDLAAVHVAEQPEGPWSDPGLMRFSCRTQYFPNCYHLSVHPELGNGRTQVFHHFDANPGTFPDIPLLTARLCLEGEAAAFSDVGPNHPFRTEIDDRADACVLGGFTNGTFNPAGTITRQAMLAFLWRQEGFDPDRHDLSGLADPNTVASTFRNQVGWAHDEGHTAAFASIGSWNQIQGGAIVDRSEAMDLLYRAACSPSGPYSEPFTDVSNTHPHHDAIAWAYQNGIAEGFTPTTFQPATDVSRQAAAAFFYRAVDPGVDDAC
jgi:hypothetical protein